MELGNPMAENHGLDVDEESITSQSADINKTACNTQRGLADLQPLEHIITDSL
jgi:hypothetical protein